MNRIQLSRAKGWRLPAGALVVDRRSPWGNPWPVGKPVDGVVVMVDGQLLPYRPTREQSIAMYRRWLAEQILNRGGDFLRPVLRAHQLACWCPLDLPCHADVLIEVSHERSLFRWAELATGAMPVLPAPGERLTFGVHRQTEADAETAPAWAPITEASKIAKFKREQRAFAKASRS